MIISLDGIFGLPRKKAAGLSYREPVHGPLFFCDQHSVDEYVNSYSITKKVHMVNCTHIFKIKLLFVFVRIVTISLLVVCYGALADTRHWMKLQCLVLLVGMNFRCCFLI